MSDEGDDNREFARLLASELGISYHAPGDPLTELDNLVAQYALMSPTPNATHRPTQISSPHDAQRHLLQNDDDFADTVDDYAGPPISRVSHPQAAASSQRQPPSHAPREARVGIATPSLVASLLSQQARSADRSRSPRVGFSNAASQNAPTRQSGSAAQNGNRPRTVKAPLSASIVKPQPVLAAPKPSRGAPVSLRRQLPESIDGSDDSARGRCPPRRRRLSTTGDGEDYSSHRARVYDSVRKGGRRELEPDTGRDSEDSGEPFHPASDEDSVSDDDRGHPRGGATCASGRNRGDVRNRSISDGDGSSFSGYVPRRGAEGRGARGPLERINESTRDRRPDRDPRTRRRLSESADVSFNPSSPSPMPRGRVKAQPGEVPWQRNFIHPDAAETETRRSRSALAVSPRQRVVVIARGDGLVYSSELRPQAPPRHRSTTSGGAPRAGQPTRQPDGVRSKSPPTARGGLSASLGPFEATVSRSHVAALEKAAAAAAAEGDGGGLDGRERYGGGVMARSQPPRAAPPAAPASPTMTLGSLDGRMSPDDAVRRARARISAVRRGMRATSIDRVPPQRGGGGHSAPPMGRSTVRTRRGGPASLDSFDHSALDPSVYSYVPVTPNRGGGVPGGDVSRMSNRQAPYALGASGTHRSRRERAVHQRTRSLPPSPHSPNVIDASTIVDCVSLRPPSPMRAIFPTGGAGSIAGPAVIPTAMQSANVATIGDTVVIDLPAHDYRRAATAHGGAAGGPLVTLSVPAAIAASRLGSLTLAGSTAGDGGCIPPGPCAARDASDEAVAAASAAVAAAPVLPKWWFAQSLSAATADPLLPGGGLPPPHPSAYRSTTLSPMSVTLSPSVASPTLSGPGYRFGPSSDDGVVDSPARHGGMAPSGPAVGRPGPPLDAADTLGGSLVRGGGGGRHEPAGAGSLLGLGGAPPSGVVGGLDRVAIGVGDGIDAVGDVVTVLDGGINAGSETVAQSPTRGAGLNYNRVLAATPIPPPRGVTTAPRTDTLLGYAPHAPTLGSSLGRSHALAPPAHDSQRSPTRAETRKALSPFAATGSVLPAIAALAAPPLGPSSGAPDDAAAIVFARAELDRKEAAARTKARSLLLRARALADVADRTLAKSKAAGGDDGTPALTPDAVATAALGLYAAVCEASGIAGVVPGASAGVGVAAVAAAEGSVAALANDLRAQLQDEAADVAAQRERVAVHERELVARGAAVASAEEALASRTARLEAREREVEARATAVAAREENAARRVAAAVEDVAASGRVAADATAASAVALREAEDARADAREHAAAVLAAEEATAAARRDAAASEAASVEANARAAHALSRLAGVEGERDAMAAKSAAAESALRDATSDIRRLKEELARSAAAFAAADARAHAAAAAVAEEVSIATAAKEASDEATHRAEAAEAAVRGVLAERDAAHAMLVEVEGRRQLGDAARQQQAAAVDEALGAARASIATLSERVKVLETELAAARAATPTSTRGAGEMVAGPAAVAAQSGFSPFIPSSIAVAPIQADAQCHPATATAGGVSVGGEIRFPSTAAASRTSLGSFATATERFPSEYVDRYDPSVGPRNVVSRSASRVSGAARSPRRAPIPPPLPRVATMSPPRILTAPMPVRARSVGSPSPTKGDRARTAGRASASPHRDTDHDLASTRDQSVSRAMQRIARDRAVLKDVVGVLEREHAALRVAADEINAHRAAHGLPPVALGAVSGTSPSGLETAPSASASRSPRRKQRPSVGGYERVHAPAAHEVERAERMGSRRGSARPRPGSPRRDAWFDASPRRR